MTAQTKRAKHGSGILMFLLNNKAMLLMLVVALFAACSTGGLFVRLQNIDNVTRQVSVLAIVAIGYTIVVAGGGLDLSVGETLSLCVVTYGVLVQTLPIYLAMLASVLVGAACGAFNGFMIRRFNLPAFVLTLSAGQIYKGIAHIITQGKSIGQKNTVVKFIGQGRLFDFLPLPFLIAVVMMVLVAILMNKTLFGRQLLAAGGNADAADVSGIRVNRVKIGAHVISGMLYGVAAIVLTGRTGLANATSGDGYTMDAIAAVVIGGTNMKGGRAKVVGTLFGVLLIGITSNMLNLLRVDTFYQWIFKGMILIIALLLDGLTEVVAAKQRVAMQSMKG